MNYKYWTHRKGSILVEKYIGEMSLSQIVANDDEMFASVETKEDQLLGLTDISSASIKNISFTEIKDLFAGIDKHEDVTKGMKIALYVGSNSYDDFLKACEYSEQDADRPLSIIPFNHLDTAMIWLGLTDEEKTLITEQLQNFK